MKKAGLLTTGFLAATMFFAANDSHGQSRLVAFNDVSGKEVKANVASIMKQGSAGEAHSFSSQHNALVLHISGGTQDKYSAEQYAKMFKIMFKDQNRSDFPTDISVIYEESGDNLPTGVFAFINGITFDKNGGDYKSGDGVFTAKELVGWIPQITASHANANGIASLTQSTSEGVAMNR